jgi:hypothetical protein
MNTPTVLPIEAYTYAEQCALRALPLFVKYNWTYWNMSKPSLDALVDTIIRLMNMAKDKPYCPIASGRFVVYYGPDSGVRQEGYFTVALDLGWEE